MAGENIYCRNAIFLYGMVKHSVCEYEIGEVKVELIIVGTGTIAPLLRYVEKSMILSRG